MSIISSYDVDSSAALAKRFAALATTYVDDPTVAKSDTAKVPLENLFRILEMFRYDAFADESRRGILAMDGFNQRHSPKGRDPSWHTPIVTALERAFDAAFNAVSKDDAINEIEEGLRGLASGAGLPQAQAQRIKAFFSTLESTLA
jgi:hypothetical protein